MLLYGLVLRDFILFKSYQFSHKPYFFFEGKNEAAIELFNLRNVYKLLTNSTLSNIVYAFILHDVFVILKKRF
ncbi:MAG: hypothetical protein ACI9O8_000800 [Patiriisocius sp.]|jgi:hypothetical protein